MTTIVAPLDMFGQPQIRVVDVTAEMARSLLERNIGNRPITSALVNRYARDMVNGRWKMAGDPIRLSKTGKVLDGQHRLTAILKTGVTVPCVVMTDLDDSIFNVIDTGRTRSKSDVIFIEHGLPVETSKLASSAAMLIYAYSNHLYSFKAKITNDELEDFVRSNPGIVQAALYVKDHVPHESPAPKAIAVAFYYFAVALDPYKAEQFIARFMVGAVEGAEDNLLHLRNACFGARANRRPIQTSELLGRLVKIWNAERRGKPIRYFGNTSLRQDEAFPRFI